jgi:hypothetical protein
MLHWDSKRVAQLLCQHMCLVECSAEQAAEVQWHRHDSLWKWSAPEANGLQQYSTQYLAASQTAVVLEAAHKLLYGKLVLQSSHRSVP